MASCCSCRCPVSLTPTVSWMLFCRKKIRTVSIRPRSQNFLGGDERSLPVFPRAVRELIVSAADEEELTGKRGLVLAKSTLLGDVMRAVLEHLGLETHVAVLESVRELPLPFLTQADVIVTALGEPHLLKGEMFKEGAIVIDGGIVSTKSGVQGDVDPVGLAEKKGF
ncbi:MAG: hypothetical protein WDN67_03340 [Candidatus Moraniibacteriota bacterium]